MTKPNSIVPCLWMTDQAEAAVAQYLKVFPGGRIVATSHYPERRDNPSGRPPGSVLTVEFEIMGVRFTALNGGPVFAPNPTVSFFVHADDEAHVDRMVKGLAEGGKMLMELGTYPWSKRYGWVQDRWGVSWQVMVNDVSGDDAKIAPAIMFSGDVQGRAEEAMKLWTTLFPGGRIDALSPYPPGGEAKGVMHGRIHVMGTRLVAFDSHISHGVKFDEGISLQITCKDQAEIDRVWSAIVANGGQEVQCGWAKDRFGFNWQVVPESMVTLMTVGTPESQARVFDAMMPMKKLDVAKLEAAARG
ncbi:MAG: VOC family protein [Polyangiaceae bacterium]